MIYETKKIITASDCDGTVRLGTPQTFAMLQDGMTACLGAMDIDNVPLREKYGAFWVVYKTRLQFLRRPDWNEPITLRVFPIDERRVRTHINMELRSEMGETLVLGCQELVPLDLATHRPRRLSDFPYPTAGFPPAVCPPDFDKLAFDPAADEPVFRQKMYSQYIDMSHHVNNVEYVRLALSVFPHQMLMEKAVTEVEIHYDCECREGEELLIARQGAYPDCFVRITRGGDTACRARFRFAD
ncbi:MAG: hypothetical protein GXW99_03035 [Clostridiales bacterium]|nr:hypothetical protein [Clostridiales bacterium]